MISSPIPSPNLDDRTFDQLVQDAIESIKRECPEWSDLSPGDPGRALLEAFAFLTETLIYRVNRLPEKAYIEFLRLIGVRLHPPAAASTSLVFSRARAANQLLEIPRGTRVTLAQPGGAREAPMFVTSRAVVIPAGETQASVLAFNCDRVEAELAGVGTGTPGLTVAVRHPPIVAPTSDGLELLVGVEALSSELSERVSAVRHGDKTYRIWREVDNFANLGRDDEVFVADRMMGLITFAPATRRSSPNGSLEQAAVALAATPAAGREIRVWYASGGGSQGNVPANSLRLLKDPIAGTGVRVTNPDAATGGQAAETLENALIRGPYELRSLERAVTGSDFEQIALRASHGAVARARAITSASLWAHASPGTVDVLLVPSVASEESSGTTVAADMLRAQETEDCRSRVQTTLDQRRPLGTRCQVSWARYKVVSVRARVVVRRQEDRHAVQQRVIARLCRTISPLPTTRTSTGWRFGQALRVSNVYDIALAEPGVRWVDNVEMGVDEVPESAVAAVAADVNQPRTWYAGSDRVLFRSLDDGEGWEPIKHFSGERVTRVCAHPGRAGLVAVTTQRGDSQNARVYMTWDCGETWAEDSVATMAFSVEDVAWTMRDDVPLLLLATDKGLYELDARHGATPVQVLVDPANQDRTFYGVAATVDVRGVVSVAVAAAATGGVFVSREGGRVGSFRNIGLVGEDIRALAVQYSGPRSFLWAAAAAAGPEDLGKGCFSWELTGPADPPEGWQPHAQGWRAGSCLALAFQEDKVVAATFRGGVMRLDTAKPDAAWESPSVEGGLPMRDPGRFDRVDDVAVDPAGRLVLGGGPDGVFRSRGREATYQKLSNKWFTDKVTLPETWLFCSGEHDITVVSEDEAE